MKKTNFSLLALLFCVFAVNNVFSQPITKKILTRDKERDQYHFARSGESKIKYLEFDEFVIRQEGPVIQFLDENLKQVDIIELPVEGEVIDYSINQDDNFLYILQVLDGTKAPKFTLFKMDLYDFNNYETIEITEDQNINDVRIHVLNNNAFIATYDKNALKGIFHVSPGKRGAEEKDFMRLASEYTEGGTWPSMIVNEDQLLLSAYKKDASGLYSQTIYLNESFEVVKEKITITNTETNEITVIDENGESISNAPLNYKDALKDIPPYSVMVNGAPIWVKNVYDVGKFIPSLKTTLISRDEQQIDLDLNSHLKKEMKSSGILKSTGLSAPIVYADPVNNSITLQYWKIVYVQGIPVESFIYFVLDEEFNLRNTYKVKLSRYPLASAPTQQFAAQYTSSILKTNPPITFTIDKTPKKWEGKSTQGKNNAFDFVFDMDDNDGLYTVINALNRQYLFIDYADGSTTGYIFN